MTSAGPSTDSSTRLFALALDYSVLDHLQRIQNGTYTGARAEALRRIRLAAESRRVDIWIAEITLVEMLHGIEKIGAHEPKVARATARDQAKLDIAAAMMARKLAYPCSKMDDTYSRLDISFRFAGPDWDRADALERRLLSIEGVSAGDARQLVSCAFPTDEIDVAFHPQLDSFVTEDTALVRALTIEIAAGNLPELSHLSVGTSADIVASNPMYFPTL